MNIVITVLAAIFVFGFIIFFHELGHFTLAKLSGVTVREFSIGMGPKLFSWGKTTKYSLRALPIGGFVSMEGEDEESADAGSFSRAPIINRILIILAGGVMNLLLGFLIIVILTSTQGAIVSKTVAEFSDNALTQQTGLAVGDTIYSINGRRLYVANDIIYEMQRVKDGTADVIVIRDGEKTEIKNVKFATTVDEDGNTGIVIDFKVVGQPKTVFSVLKEAALKTLSIMRLVVVTVIDLITGNVAVNNLSGPIGIVTIISKAAAVSFESLMNLMAMISINLGIFNLLPLPALDGGKMVFIIYEGITKKKPNPKFEVAVTVVGFVLLIGLMLFVSYNDITRLIK